MKILNRGKDSKDTESFNKIKVNEDNSICVLKNNCITQDIFDKLIEQNLIKEIR